MKTHLFSGLDQLRLLFVWLAILLTVAPSCFGERDDRPSAAYPNFVKSYRAYLERDYPIKVTRFVVGKDTMKVQLTIRKPGHQKKIDDLAIGVLPPYVASQSPLVAGHLLGAKLVRDGESYSATFPRRNNKGVDRSHCRFVVVQRSRAGRLLRLSASVYPSSWQPGVQRDLERLVGRDRKGLGGIPNDSAKSDHAIYTLGLSHATVNIVLNGLVALAPADGREKWVFEGRELYIDQGRLTGYDQRLERLREKQIVPSIILLVSNRRKNEGGEHKQRKDDLLIHPEADPKGLFAMPNLANRDGAFLYRATLFLLAERYSREGPSTGRVSNWIMHNEIDQSGTWTTMGDQPIERYIETFMRSARLAYHTTRQFDPASRVFVSLTHHWNRLGHGKATFRARDVVDLCAESSRVEGDFEWGIAYHPYPSRLRNPRAWDDVGAELDFETPLITTRNIEVLPAYLRQQRLLFLGKHPRAILLSEQGCSAPSMAIEDQRLQAAGVVYMFHRMRQLPTIEAFHYHAYRDSPTVEGGARFGLVDENEEPKFAWEVYQSLNSPAEEQAVKFAWDIMGESARRDATTLRQVD